MKKLNREFVTQLEQLPNVGPAIAGDFRQIGIYRPSQLAGKDAITLYGKLCRKTKCRHDPCVIDVFMSAIHFMDTGQSRPWWSFTPQRKKILSKKA